jgi:hypothetical protein
VSGFVRPLAFELLSLGHIPSAVFRFERSLWVKDLV